MAQPLRVLTALAEDQGSIPNTHMAAKNHIMLGMVAHTFNPSIQEAEAGGSLLVQGQPGL